MGPDGGDPQGRIFDVGAEEGSRHLRDGAAKQSAWPNPLKPLRISTGISPTAPTMLTTIGPLIGIGLPPADAGMWTEPEATKVPVAQVTKPADKGD